MSDPEEWDERAQQDLSEFLEELSTNDQERLMTLLATRIDPHRIVEPLVEGVHEALGELDPDMVSKAEVKDSVRRALVETMQTRKTHLVQLAQLRRLCDEAADTQAVRRKLDDLCRTSGLKRVTNTDDLTHFRVADDEGTEFVVVQRAAFVDGTDDRTVLAGEIKRTDVPPPAPQRKSWEQPDREAKQRRKGSGDKPRNRRKRA